MKYRVGDVVKIKSRKWYNKNKNGHKMVRKWNDIHASRK